MLIFKHFSVLLLLLMTSTSVVVYSLSPLESSITDNHVIQAFDSADVPLTEYMIKLTAALISSPETRDGKISILGNYCKLNDYVSNGYSSYYDVSFNYESLELNSKNYSSISGSINIINETSKIDLPFFSLQGNFLLSGQGIIKNIYFYQNSEDYSKIIVNGIDMTDDLNIYFETYSRKYVCISTSIFEGL